MCTQERTAAERLMFLELEIMQHREAAHGIEDNLDFTAFPNCPRCNELEGQVTNLSRFINSPTEGIQ